MDDFEVIIFVSEHIRKRIRMVRRAAMVAHRGIRDVLADGIVDIPIILALHWHPNPRCDRN